MTIQTSLTFFMVCILVLLMIGIVVLTWGKRLPGKGSWLVWSGFILLLTGIGLDAGLLANEEFRTKIWMSGWIWSREEQGAITVGVVQDSLGLAMSTLVSLMAGALLLNQGFLSREPRSDRSYAALAISTSGVTLSWISLTPWLSFAGLVLTLLGGFISLSSRGDNPSEANIAARFLWERSAGFLLAFFGACILASSHAALLLNQSEPWILTDPNLSSTWVGSILLVTGLFVQMLPFPLLGWVVSESELYAPNRILLSQIFPALCAFSLLLRLQPQLLSLGLFPGFGWVALLSCVLAVFAGLFQNRWRLTLGVWLSAGISLSIAFLAFSGPLPALSLLIGVSLGALCLSSTASALEGGLTSTVPNHKVGTWLRITSVLGAASGTGVIGFVSATGGIRWMAQAMNVPGAAAGFLIIFFLFVLLGWKLAWNVIQIQGSHEPPWVSIVSPLIWVFLSLGAVWTGGVTGEVYPGLSDHLWMSLFQQFFGAKSTEFSSSTDLASASGLYWGGLVLAFSTAYWTSGGKEDRWVALSKIFPRASQFIARGYGADRVFERINDGFIWSGKTADRIVDQKIWMEWIPQGLSRGTRTLSGWASRIDSQLSSGLVEALRRLVEVPAKILQLIQTGDLRWYLLFALGSGFALLSHFLKT